MPPQRPESQALSPQDELIAFAARLADAAGAVVRSYFRAELAVEDKADRTPVTLADREAEATIRRLIEAEHPDHGVVGEEHGADRPEAEHVWVLDPIDGTKRFITGNPLFGTLIALLRRGAPVLGVIDMPALGERWIGAEGRPTRFLAGGKVREVAARPCAALDQAILSATSPDMFAGPDLAAFERVRRAAKTTLYGGDCYNYALVAGGHADLVIEARMSAYDFLALVPVVAGAGGVMSDWAGRPLGLESDGRVAAAGDPGLHAQALDLLRAG